MSATNPAQEDLRKISLATFAPAKTLDTVLNTDLIETVLQKEHTPGHGHLSFPVLNAAGEFVGLIDMLDIISLTLTCAPTQADLEADKAAALERWGRAVALSTVGHAMNLSGRDPMIPLDGASPVSEAVAFLSKYTHRVPVLAHGQLSSVVSQHDIGRWLGEHLGVHELKNMATLTMQDLSLGVNSTIISLPHTATVLEALQTIDSKKVSAVAIVHPHSGELAAEFSCADIRHLFHSDMSEMSLSVVDYLNLHAKHSAAPKTVTKMSTLLEVVHLLNTQHVHRAWLLFAGAPIGVVSLTDIMQVVNSYTLQ